MLSRSKTLGINWSFMSSSKVWWQASNTSSRDILGKLSHQMLSASILGNLYFQVTIWCAHPVRVWCFLYECHMTLRVYSLKFGGTKIYLQSLRVCCKNIATPKYAYYLFILLKYSWFTILYLFQVYIIVIQYFYRLYSI